jgi:UDP-2-acetamido-2-deoxy-ribo-hexuluronate aminotransferase
MITNDKPLAEKLKMIANHGQKIKYHHDSIGVNSRLDTLQAAVLLVKLKFLDDYSARRNAVADFYDKELSDVEEIKIPARAPYSTHVFHQYTLQAQKRDQLKSFLERKGIPTMIYYPVPLHLQTAYRMSGFEEGAFPVTEMLSKTVISLPIHTEMSDDQLYIISNAVKEFYS